MGDATHVPSTPENLQGGTVDPGAEPVATVAPGEAVVVDTVWPVHVDALTSRGVPRSAVLDDEVRARREMTRDGPGPHWLTGPVRVEGAEPGDVLEVRVRDVALRTDYAFNLFERGIGLLPGAFAGTTLQVVRLDRDRGTALETSLTGEFEFHVHEDVPHLAAPLVETGSHYVVVGLDEDLDVALEEAVRAAVGLLVRQHGLSPGEAYAACSAAVDFEVSQAVNGTKGVHGLIPKSALDDAGRIDPGRFDAPVRWEG